MPFVEIHVIKDVFSKTQKQDMIKKVTDALVSVEGDYMRPVTWVVVKEVESGEWGIGGRPVTVEDIKAMAAGGKNHDTK
jgi:4-oxalocrotonate tautomerase